MIDLNAQIKMVDDINNNLPESVIRIGIPQMILAGYTKKELRRVIEEHGSNPTLTYRQVMGKMFAREGCCRWALGQEMSDLTLEHRFWVKTKEFMEVRIDFVDRTVRYDVSADGDFTSLRCLVVDSDMKHIRVNFVFLHNRPFQAIVKRDDVTTIHDFKYCSNKKHYVCEDKLNFPLHPAFDKNFDWSMFK